MEPRTIPGPRPWRKAQTAAMSKKSEEKNKHSHYLLDVYVLYVIRYSGNLVIYFIQSQEVVKSVEASGSIS